MEATINTQQTSLYLMRKWWITKAKWYHHKTGHFDMDLYLRVCEIKNQRLNEEQNNKRGQ